MYLIQSSRDGREWTAGTMHRDAAAVHQTMQRHGFRYSELWGLFQDLLDGYPLTTETGTWIRMKVIQ